MKTSRFLALVALVLAGAAFSACDGDSDNGATSDEAANEDAAAGDDDEEGSEAGEADHESLDATLTTTPGADTGGGCETEYTWTISPDGERFAGKTARIQFGEPAEPRFAEAEVGDDGTVTFFAHTAPCSGSAAAILVDVDGNAVGVNG